MSNEGVVESAVSAPNAKSIVLKHLPGYARFVRENCLIPYVQEQIRASRELDLPLLKYLGDIRDDELLSMAAASNTNFLQAIEDNRLAEHLSRSLERWSADKLTIMKRDQVTAEDINLAGYIRKKALLKFLPGYTTDVGEATDIIAEIDLVTLEGDNAATNVYIQLLKDRISLQVENEKQMSDKLREGEKIMLKANELAQVGNWTWDLTTNKIEWSDELYNIYGITRDFELTFDKIIAFTAPEDMPRIKHNLRIAKETLEPSEAYYHITLGNGSQKILHAKTETFADSTGVAVKMIGVIQDVTGKQLMIERLQNSEALYKQAQAISHIGNWSWNLITKELVWSDEMYRIYELPPGPVTYSDDIGIYNHPDDDAKVRAHMRRTIETLESFDFSYRIVLKSGKIKTLNARGAVKTDAEGKAVTLYGTVQDITQQQLIAKQLRDYREFLNKITDVTPSIIAAYNIHTGKYSFINQAIEKMLGYPVSKIMEEGVPFLASIIHPDDVAQLMEKNEQALTEANNMPAGEAEPIAEFKYRMRNKDGDYRWFHTYGTVFERNATGQVESVLNVSVDITGQEVAEQALYKKNIQLQQSNSNLEEYAYVASHDLKEPLRKIATFSDRLLSTQTSLTTDGKTYLSKIISSAIRMQRMIDDLLAVSTIHGNDTPELCDLNTLFTEAMQSLDFKIEESKAIIESDRLPSATVVPSQFRQMFQNLVNNSLKFAREGVAPHIRISHETILPSAVTGMHLAKAAKYLRIDIADNGIGFDNEYAARIFAIFQRLHSKSEYEGTGIGLAVCKKIAESHGGAIFAKGTPGSGAVFSIIIPA